MAKSPIKSKSVAATPCDTWRRNSTKSFLALNAFIFLVFISVHWMTLSLGRSKLPLDGVLTALEANCSAQAGSPTLTSARLLPEYYGLGVWVDSPALLPGVHAALTLMKERLTDSRDTAAATAPLPRNVFSSFVRLESRMRDQRVAGLAQEARNNASPIQKRAADELKHLANQQQLGLPTLKHVFLPEVGQDVELLGLSLFSVPVFALPQDAASRVQCFLAGVKHAYCVFPVEEPDASGVNSEGADTVGATATNFTAAPRTPLSYRLQAASLEAEVRAALLSVVAQQIELASFKPADVAVWRQSRERMACLYTIASVKSTMRILAANTLMSIPHSTKKMLDDLERHVHSLSFLRAARAADSLLFHPSLSPQLYIPWDHALLSQLLVLLPALICMLLAVRFTLDDRQSDRVRAKAIAEAASEKKEQ
ncbi:hypothetical protein JKF63_02621 [Porcisia hertigi]|uniref:GPI transamidase component Tta1 n=1 Tax=Porcisia hertigi TaxID=2761500 RepID=A0A836HNZ8_9TRYP|nr:hypothetical protein JKF63_02621 [Porcisia hertigi]